LFVGGTLIRRFDGFRRLCRAAAADYGHPLTVTDEAMLLANRILAGLGGPPAAAEVRGRADSDIVPLLLLFFLTQEMPCRIGLLGQAEPVLTRLKGLVHLFSHAVYPKLSGEGALSFQDVVKELGPSGAVLRPLVQYDDQDGEPLSIALAGAAGRVGVGAEHGPYTLAVLLGEGGGPAPLAPVAEGGLHPVVLILP
jgi:hypothetical protein